MYLSIVLGTLKYLSGRNAFIYRCIADSVVEGPVEKRGI